MSIRGALSAYKLYKKYAKYIDPVVNWLKSVFVKAKEEGKFEGQLPPNHPDKKLTPEDILRGDGNV
jgi:hypothetical protein